MTVIKNEHLYLDDWITYHLSIGVSHIFLFEDFDSKTHKEITDKYPQVTLQNVLDVIQSEEQLREIHFRKRMLQSNQNSYYKNGMRWIKEHYDYDWCFVIDADEYITCDNLSDTLAEFKDYDAVFLSWQNYGANGHITIPDYSRQSIIEIYSKPCNWARDDYNNTIKTVYNLHTWTEEFHKSPHSCSDLCKWCKTNFVHDKIERVFDKMYLRHYITKSWEEYIVKIKVRGVFYVFHRHYDDFFLMNPELKDRQEELEAMIPEIINKHRNKNKRL